jgi:hypothetical protein
MSHYTPYWHASLGYPGPSPCCGRVATVPLYPAMMPYYVMPMPGVPGWPAGSSSMVVALEASVDSAAGSKSALVGGNNSAHLTLEYVPDDGATSPSVIVTVTSGGSATSTWQETAIGPGYHVKSDFATLPPGSKVTIEVKEASARLRWCETVCC